MGTNAKYLPRLTRPTCEAHALRGKTSRRRLAPLRKQKPFVLQSCVTLTDWTNFTIFAKLFAIVAATYKTWHIVEVTLATQLLKLILFFVHFFKTL